MSEIQCNDIGSIQELIAYVNTDTKDWARDGFAKGGEFLDNADEAIDIAIDFVGRHIKRRSQQYIGFYGALSSHTAPSGYRR